MLVEILGEAVEEGAVAGPEGFEPSTIPRTSRMDSFFRLRASALESAALPG